MIRSLLFSDFFHFSQTKFKATFGHDYVAPAADKAAKEEKPKAAKEEKPKPAKDDKAKAKEDKAAKHAQPAAAKHDDSDAKKVRDVNLFIYYSYFLCSFLVFL